MLANGVSQGFAKEGDKTGQLAKDLDKMLKNRQLARRTLKVRTSLNFQWL